MAAFALLPAGCGAKASGPPDILVDRTACSHCGMLVSEPRFAAAYQAQGHEPRVFDDIGCLLDALRRETASPITMWFQDADGSGWLDAGAAVFVTSPHVRAPMSGGVLAYRDAAAAETSAIAHQGEVVRSFHDLVIRKGNAK